MSHAKIIDHLFRHQYGKMVSILTNAFGLQHLETIEDAIQDTFQKAISAWRINMPENPEGWLLTAAKNRTIDLFRKIKSEKNRQSLYSGPASIAIQEIFAEHEIEDSQLRMIFTACHPLLPVEEQIVFALKTISGFSLHEISAALLTKESTVKKRLQRARKKITHENIVFEIPSGKALEARQQSVLDTLYLLFNEGFHSNGKSKLIREELCGEAIRLCGLLINKKPGEQHSANALLALMCFHAARLDSKVDQEGNMISLRKQDRAIWDFDMMLVGNLQMNEAVKAEYFSSFHYEAAIAAEHLKAETFEATDWSQIAIWYEQLAILQPSDFLNLNRAIVQMQLKDYVQAEAILKKISVDKLEQKKYLYYSTSAELATLQEDHAAALKLFDLAIEQVHNERERNFLLKKKSELSFYNNDKS